MLVAVRAEGGEEAEQQILSQVGEGHIWSFYGSQYMQHHLYVTSGTASKLVPFSFSPSACKPKQVLGSLPLVSRQHVQGGVVDRVVYSSTTATSEGSGSSLSPSTGSEHGEGGGVLSPLDLFGPGVRLTSALLSSPTNPPSKPDAMVEAEGGADVAVVVMKRHVFKGDGQETTLNAVLERARQSGLILAGARLVYPPTTDHEVRGPPPLFNHVRTRVYR